jgi:hypothetical protein
MNEALKAGFHFHNLLTWKKNNATPNRWYMQNSELILFFRKGKAKAINNCGSKTVLEVDNIIGNKVHPTEKPVELMEILISNSSKENDVVFDPFAGSGATLQAAKNLNRNAIGIEIDEEYFDIASERLNINQEVLNPKKETNKEIINLTNKEVNTMRIEVENKIITEIENLSLPMFGAIIEHSNNDNTIKKHFDAHLVEMLVNDLSATYKDEMFHLLPNYTLLICLEMLSFWGYMNTCVIGKALRILTENEPDELLDEMDLVSIRNQVYGRVKYSYQSLYATNKAA